MAEGIIIPVFADLLSKLGSSALQEIGLIYGVKEEFAKLKDTFSAMQSVLRDAERKGDQSLAIKDWLGKLKDTVYDADDLLDELSYETLRREMISRDKYSKKVRIFFSKHNQLVFNAKMVHNIKKLRQRLELIAADRTQFHFLETIQDQSKTKDREYTHSFVLEKEVIGRDEDKEDLVKRLVEINEKQNVSVDAIVGLGGLGKTMLAQSVFNHKRVEDAFDLRLWVCISEIFDLKIIVEKVIEAATEERPFGLEMDSLQRKLRKEIDGKKFLLVMDDVWNEDGERWAELKRLLMGGAKGSKILITTRSKLVAEVSEATSPYILKGLSESSSWILFKQMAFKECEEPESPNMLEIGKDIASKCMGVPLVIRTVGRLLYFKTSEVEWLSFKNSVLSTFTQRENEITQALQLSYNHLPSYLKSCFAYCSLFPKDHVFEKDELIKLWVAEGFVQSRGENECLEDVGNEYFMELVWRSFFQDVLTNEYGDVVECKMHDLMHDLAQFVAGTECFTSDSNIKNANERTRRILYDCSDGLMWDVLLTTQLKLYKLRTFFNWYSCELNETGLDAHESSLKSLRVLDLQWVHIRKVPFSIGMFKHLRFLNLLGNRKIMSLPSSITKLHFLQTLNLKSCSLLIKLPEDIGSLVNLRHLDISETALELLPNSLTKLYFLQTLNLKSCSLLRELPKNIGSLINLRHLYLSYNKFIERLPNSTSKLLHLEKLILHHCTSLIELPENIDNMVDLRFLKLSWNDRIELLPNSIVMLQKLQVLSLSCCGSLRELPRDVSNLVNLKHLDLEGCFGLRGMPLGLNKITGLQTLNLYVVGPLVSSDNSGLWQLNTLINIRGRLCIEGLHHLRKDSSQVNTVNLKNNHGVCDLTLKWGKTFERDKYTWDEYVSHRNGIHRDFVVLEKLQPNKNVETLTIVRYGGFKLSNWVSSLSNLTHITIESCERLEYIPRLDQLPNLQNLRLSDLNLIEYMDNNETVDEFNSSVFFPSLQSLTLCRMYKLRGWWKSREFPPKDPGQSFLLPSFHCLANLEIGGCPEMFSIPLSNSSLKTLHLNCSGAEWFEREVIVSASPEDDPQREALDDGDDLHSKGGLEGFQHLTALHSLAIVNWYHLVMLPDWIGNFTSLQELKIINCPKLTLLPEGIRRLSSLRSLTIHGCIILEERCRPQIGEDWSKIAHVKRINIS